MRQNNINITIISDQGYKHQLHSKEPHLNSLTNLLISLSTSLQTHQTHTYHILDRFNSKIEQQNQNLEDLR